MNKNLFKIVVTMLVLAGMISCQSKSEADQPLTALEGTKWNLVGIVDAIGALKVLEPKDCERCYTITFDTDSTFFAYSSLNEIIGSYIADYETCSSQITVKGITKALDFGDGELYCEVFISAQFFSFTNKELRIFYTDNKNYLLFKSQQP